LLSGMVAIIAAYTKGPRWRAFALPLTIVNCTALAATTLGYTGPSYDFFAAMLDAAVAAYLWLIMAVKANDECGSA
jgi:hypothetical protein